MKKYYEAYDNRYKTIHEKGMSWSSDIPTPLIIKIIKRLKVSNDLPILEIGCGEGRDSIEVLKKGYNLLATDISQEAINYCKQKYPEYKDRFAVLDCLKDEHKEKYSFIFSVAVIHMLILDEDRNKFYEFIFKHLDKNGKTLILSMGDGETEFHTDINEAFLEKERDYVSGKVKVAATSCRMISMENFEKEVKNSDLKIIEKGMTESLPDFNQMLYILAEKE